MLGGGKRENARKTQRVTIFLPKIYNVMVLDQSIDTGWTKKKQNGGVGQKKDFACKHHFLFFLPYFSEFFVWPYFRLPPQGELNV